jgi:predicted deacylase
MTNSAPGLGPRDLTPYRAGNTRIPYVHRFESGRPGPHVVVNALTHGNEFCGMVAATHLLDIHSTAHEVEPFWVYPGHERNARAATAIGLPPLHLVMPQGIGSGTPLIEHGRHGQADFHGVGLVAECGQHFAPASGELATEVALRFLAHFGLVDADPAWAPPAPQRRYELIRTYVVKSEDAAFTRPLIGMETFDQGELIATNGDEEVRSPCDGCTVFMPTRKPIVGRELVYLTRRVG